MTQREQMLGKIYRALRDAGYIVESLGIEYGLLKIWTHSDFDSDREIPSAMVAVKDGRGDRPYGALAPTELQAKLFELLDPVVSRS